MEEHQSSGPAVGTGMFDASGKRLKDGPAHDAVDLEILGPLLASIGLTGAAGGVAGALPEADTAVACLELHYGPGVVGIQVLVALTGTPSAPHALNFLEGELRGDICSVPGTTWRVIGGFDEPEIPAAKRSRFAGQMLSIYAERGPLGSNEAEAVGGNPGGCADAMMIVGWHVDPGLYRGFYAFLPISSIFDFKPCNTLFKGWQQCWA